MIPVHEKGYIILIDKMGDDLRVVNAAKVSYDKASTVLTEKEERLIKFLALNEHTSPFRHPMMTFEVYAPLMVARQWWKYVVGSDHTMDGWNESSRRYVTEEPVFYIPRPNEWRGTPENKKQGSAAPLDEVKGFTWTHELEAFCQRGEQLYKSAMASGVCAEQARLFLPAYGMYVRWYWTTSLQGALHFLDQRLEHDAQFEIQQFAKAIDVAVREHFPVTYKWWMNNEV